MKVLVGFPSSLLLDIDNYCLQYGFVSRSEFLQMLARDWIYSGKYKKPSYLPSTKVKKQKKGNQEETIANSFILCPIHKVYKSGCNCK